MIDVDRYISFLEKNNLNQPQFLLMYLLYLKRDDLVKRYKAMFPSNDNADVIGDISFNDLLSRGFIEKVSNGNTTNDFKLTNKFTNIFINKFEAASQVWEAYPSYMIKNGTRYPLTAFSEDEFREIYFKKIGKLKEEHEEVLKDLAYAKEHDLINCTIKNFVLSRQWMVFRKDRLNTVTDDAQFKVKEF